MIRSEFLSRIPFSIVHKRWGLGELEIIVDNELKKAVCYRHQNRTSSFGTYGKSWLEIYDDLYNHLSVNGYLK